MLIGQILIDLRVLPSIQVFVGVVKILIGNAANGMLQ
jgi:hypothetical protein